MSGEGEIENFRAFYRDIIAATCYLQTIYKVVDNLEASFRGAIKVLSNL